MGHIFRFLGHSIDDHLWALGDEETHHLSKVLRLKVGDRVEVGDGQGRWTTGSIEHIGKEQTTVRVCTPQNGLSPIQIEAPPTHRLLLCVGALKQGSFEDILPALVELGVDELHLFHQPGSAKERLADKSLKRWDRITTQAVKQCKRAWIPTLTIHDNIHSMVLEPGLAKPDSHRFFLTPDTSHTLLESLALRGKRHAGSDIILVVGGEKGLTLDEVLGLSQAGYEGVRLGPHVLRAVTAAISAAALASCYRIAAQPISC